MINQQSVELNSALFALNDLLRQYPGQNKKTLSLLIRSLLLQIDRWTESTLNRIFHHRDFQQLEASWRNLHFLVTSSSPSNKIKLKTLNVTKNELIRDFEKSVDFDYSALFKRVHEEEYGSYGGEPYSFLLGDYSFKGKARDLYLLKKLAEISAGAQAPFIGGVHEALLDLNEFSEMHSISRFERYLESHSMKSWNLFRQSENARFVALVLPKILLRLPWGRQKTRLYPGAIKFDEITQSRDDYLWGNAAFAFAQSIIRSFKQYGWPARFTGSSEKATGEVQGLPVPAFSNLDQLKMSVDIFIPDDFEKALEAQGLISLCQMKLTSKTAFHSAPTLHKPRKHIQPYNDANEHLASHLPHIITAARFSHYLKILLRSKIGTSQDKKEIEAELNQWLGNYISEIPPDSDETAASRPLHAGQVTLVESEKNPGKLLLSLKIVPFYQLEAAKAMIHLSSAVSREN